MTAKFNTIGASMSIVSGLLLAVAHGLNMGANTDYGTVLGQTFVLIAHLLLTFVFIGLYESLDHKSSGVIGWTGMVTGVIGTIFVTAIVYVELAGSSGVRVEEVFEAGMPKLLQSVGPLFFVAGTILCGVAAIRDYRASSGGGICLILGTLIFMAGSFADGAAALFSFIGGFFTGAGFIWLGLNLLNLRKAARI